MENNRIQVQDLHVSYYGKTAVENLSFSFEGGRVIGVLGPNGAGKSTMMKSLLELIPRDKGKVTLAGKLVDDMRKEIAYVPQRTDIDWDFPINVKETVLLGTYPRLGLFKRPGQKEKEWAMACLKQVHMEEFADNQIGELSGGQQQRIFLARALAQKASYFFLDEPFVGIDVKSEQIIMDILRVLAAEGKSVLVVHHDLSKVETYFDDVILMNKHLIAAGSVEDVFNPENLGKTYQKDFSDENGTGVFV